MDKFAAPGWRESTQYNPGHTNAPLPSAPTPVEIPAPSASTEQLTYASLVHETPQDEPTEPLRTLALKDQLDRNHQLTLSSPPALQPLVLLIQQLFLDSNADSVWSSLITPIWRVSIEPDHVLTSVKHILDTITERLKALHWTLACSDEVATATTPIALELGLKHAEVTELSFLVHTITWILEQLLQQADWTEADTISPLRATAQDLLKQAQKLATGLMKDVKTEDKRIFSFL